MHITFIERAVESWRMHLGSTPLWRRTFFRNVTIVAGGSLVAQMISVALSPIITRLYAPEAYGILGVFTSAVSIGVTASTLGYAQAIVLPRRDEDALKLVRLALLFSGLVALVAAAVIVPLRKSLAFALGTEGAAPYLLLVPFAIFCGGMSIALDQWLIRKKQFRESSGITIFETIFANGAKVCAGVIAPAAGTLVVTTVCGRGLHALLAALSSRATRHEAARTAPTASTLIIDEKSKLLLRQYRDFPFYRLPQMAMNSVAHSFPTVLLAFFFDPVAAGFYTLANSALHLPASIIGSAVGKVFIQRITEAAHNGESLCRLIVTATLGLAGVGAVPFALVMILGPRLFSFVFGPEWQTAGEYGTWLGLWLFFGFINVPSVSSIPILALQGQFLAYEVVTVIARAVSLLVGALVLRSEVAAIALFSITGAVFNLLLIVYTVFQSRRRLRNLDLSTEVVNFGEETQDA